MNYLKQIGLVLEEFDSNREADMEIFLSKIEKIVEAHVNEQTKLNEKEVIISFLKRSIESETK